jgi:predicted Zn-dependent peptidase
MKPTKSKSLQMKGSKMTRDDFHDLASLIADEEKGAASALIGQRIAEIKGKPDGPIRARIFAAAALIGSSELWSTLEDPATVAGQLRRLADRFEGMGQPRQ